MSDFDITSDELDKAKLDVLVAVIYKAVMDFEHAFPTKGDIKQYIKETVQCESWEDFDTMVEEIAISAEQDLGVKKHLSQGQLHGQK